MIDYIEYLGIPSTVAIVILAVFFISQCIGEVLELKGKVVPEFLKIRKYFARKKIERETMSKMPEVLDKMQIAFDDMRKHYNEDNIAMRDKWIDVVNRKLDEYDKYVKDIDKKLDRDNENILSLLIDSKRNAIIDFAANVADKNAPVTRERFRRVLKLYEEYEELIKRNGLTNGEVDVAYRIIIESYEEHTANHTFIEDIRGWK